MRPSFALPLLFAASAASAACGSSAPHAASSAPSTSPAAASAAASAPTPAPIPASADDPALRASLAAVAAESDGLVAVTVVHLGTGARASVHGDARLPLMSVFKLPLTIVALSKVERGELALDQHVTLTEAELRPTYSPIAEAWKAGEHAPTLELMLRRVIQDSDNTVGDKLVTLEGGGAAVTASLRALGAPGVDIAEQEIEMQGRLDCPGVAGPAGGWTNVALAACPKPTKDARLAAAKREVTSAPNASSTDALAAMLVALDRGTLLHAPSRTWLLDTLAGTKTGPKRLRGLLPATARVEHKTGTGATIEGFNVATNDVGIVTLPSGERFVIVALTAGSARPDDARDATIARLARAAWERFGGA